MNLKETYKNFLLQLQTIYSASEASVIADWIFEHDVKITRADIIKSPNKEISNQTIEQLNHHLTELLQHKPVQYVLGEAWFYNIKLKVNKHVLIPRPETEELVKLGVDSWQLAAGNILDVGTGSGCIAIALKKNLHAATITAIDISENALSIAKENAAIQKTAIQFLQVDFLNEKNWQTFGMFDMIASNPPYIPADEKESLDKNVTGYEPHSALFVPDEQPLLFYEKMTAFGKEHLNNNGKILAEIHENFASAVLALFKTNYHHAEIKKDIFGKDRMVIAAEPR